MHLPEACLQGGMAQLSSRAQRSGFCSPPGCGRLASEDGRIFPPLLPTLGFCVLKFSGNNSLRTNAGMLGALSSSPLNPPVT